ncbi:hypothetical protein ACW7GZ_14620 [Luteimonas sp. A537]
MVDISARSKLSEAARALVAGRITNDQFEARVPESADPAVREIFNKGFWPLYNDLKAYKLTGSDRMDADNRAFASRCILFLKTSRPYAWPFHSGLDALRLDLINLLTLGFSGRRFRRRLQTIGDVDAWPFLTHADYLAALRSPPYLTGLGPNNSFKPKPLRGSD